MLSTSLCTYYNGSIHTQECTAASPKTPVITTNEETSRGQVHYGVGGKARVSHSKVQVLPLCFSTSLKAQDRQLERAVSFP